MLAASAQAQTKLVVGYQLIVGPFPIADGSMDAALKDAGYQVDWRQFTSGGDISTALASGKVPVGVLGSTGITAAATRGVDLQLFWVLDNIGKSEALVARNGSGIASTADLKGKRVATPFVSTSHFHPLVGLEQVWKIPPRDAHPEHAAAADRGLGARRHRRGYVWPPALTEIAKSGKIIADSEQIGKASVLTFDGLVADRAWAEKTPVHGRLHRRDGQVLCRLPRQPGGLDGRLAAGQAHRQADRRQARGRGRGAGLLVFPTAAEQASGAWLGGGKEAGATRAFNASAQFLKEQKQIDKALGTTAPT